MCTWHLLGTTTDLRPLLSWGPLIVGSIPAPVTGETGSAHLHTVIALYPWLNSLLDPSPESHRLTQQPFMSNSDVYLLPFAGNLRPLWVGSGCTHFSPISPFSWMILNPPRWPHVMEQLPELHTQRCPLKYPPCTASPILLFSLGLHPLIK